jgi:DMSO/TMAO reductase YedYZ molybdopterin-dependent catalytic subunit
MRSIASVVKGGVSTAVSAALLAGSVGVAAADGPGELTVSGDVRNPLTVTMTALQAFPSRSQAVASETSARTEHHTYTGAVLDDVVSAADPVVDAAAKHPSLSIVVLATGADGYRAALAWAEGSPDLSATPILVAYTEDGLPLGQPRLVVPGDLEGARYVRDLVDLRVANLAPA